MFGMVAFTAVIVVGLLRLVFAAGHLLIAVIAAATRHRMPIAGVS
jgi:hypothetical protein